MRLYSTLQREKVELPPPPGPIRMYFCGPTVYQRIHIGNARPFVISMWLKRWLDARGYETVLVENITDINDKIYAAAPGKSAQLAAQATQWYVEDTDRLGLGRPDHEPRASETIDEIRDLIEELIRRELARMWMHNGMLRLAGEKMSKSLGNVISLEEALDQWGHETLLLYFMTAHWRKPMDLSDEVLEQARAQWLSFQGAFRVARADPVDDEWERLAGALDDDFNTPEALALLHEWRSKGFWYLLDRGLGLFGLKLPAMAGTGIEVERLRQQRDEARAREDWAEADGLREAIRKWGFDVVDEPEGSRLVPK